MSEGTRLVYGQLGGGGGLGQVPDFHPVPFSLTHPTPRRPWQEGEREYTLNQTDPRSNPDSASSCVDPGEAL